MGISIPTFRSRTAKTLGLLLATAVLVMFLLGVVLASPAEAAVSYSAEEIEFVRILNEYRVNNGLQPLLVSDMISEACDRHNSDMGKYRFFDHYTQNGSDWFAVGASPWDRMALSGYTYNTYKGENIAAGYSTAASVFQGWKNSPGHNANMLGANFKVLGVSMVYVSSSPYGYYWTTDFGGYVDPTAHSLTSAPASSTTTTAAPTTTTKAPTTTYYAPTTTSLPWWLTTTTTARYTTTTGGAPTTTLTTAPPVTTTTTLFVPLGTTTTVPWWQLLTTTTTAPRWFGTATTSPPNSTTTTLVTTPTFSDVTPSTPYADQIAYLASLGVITGYPNGTFGSLNLVTRQQFAKMIILATGSEAVPITASAFQDVEPQVGTSDPLYPGGYIEACAALGIAIGKTRNTFGPYENITRAQVITMVARAAGLSDAPAGYQAPFGNFDSDHYPWAVRAAAAGLLDGLEGMGAGFDFWKYATRGEVCMILTNLMQR